MWLARSLVIDEVDKNHMGTDIEVHYERKENGQWVYAGEGDIGRSYALFAMIANVRNMDGIKNPMEMKYSIPKDASEELRRIYDYKHEWSCGGGESWLTREELEAYRPEIDLSLVPKDLPHRGTTKEEAEEIMREFISKMPTGDSRVVFWFC